MRKRLNDIPTQTELNYVKENSMDYRYKIEQFPSYIPETDTNADIFILEKPCDIKGSKINS